ncbi:fimbrial biogenesis chaperone, partial [Burkholderia glumae]|uniref:fimbrial biogenesis chaperone n=1 Tax=Burkholderia glumae TaxID=337 RepID=UPI001E5C8D1A
FRNQRFQLHPQLVADFASCHIADDTTSATSCLGYVSGSKPRDAADVNRVQIAFRSRIKLFYRPEKLKGTSADAPSQIHWRLIRAAGKQTLEGHNPTQYYISLVDVTLLSGPHKATADGGMIGPGETHAFPLSGEEIEAAGAKVHYTTVNDYGAFVDGETPVLPSGAALLK